MDISFQIKHCVALPVRSKKIITDREDMNQIYTPNHDYKVLCLCHTYNHSNYIDDTLNGFALQKTNFPYICLVMDDNSTDGEQTIIRKWLDYECEMSDAIFIDIELSKVILVKHKTNTNCTFAVYFLKYNLYKNICLKETLVTPWRDHCVYEALCEGDDFWYDYRKLQKQHDIMEKGSYSICLNRVNMINKDGISLNNTIPRKEYRKKIVSLETVCKEEFLKCNWAFNTSSFFYRTKNYKRIQELIGSVFRKMPYGDLPVLLSNLMISDGYFIDETFGNYRVLSGGYNSSLKANKELSIKNKYLIIEALNDFNNYTNYIYSKYIDSYILRTHRNIEIENGSPFSIFKPKYLSVLTVRNVLALLLRVLHLR